MILCYVNLAKLELCFSEFPSLYCLDWSWPLERCGWVLVGRSTPPIIALWRSSTLLLVSGKVVCRWPISLLLPGWSNSWAHVFPSSGYIRNFSFSEYQAKHMCNSKVGSASFCKSPSLLGLDEVRVRYEF